MFSLFRKETPSVGSVYFRGNIPPRPEEFAHDFQRAGVTVETGQADNARWVLRARHAAWGPAEIVCLRDAPPPPPHLIEPMPSLSPAEKQEALAAGTTLTVRVESTRKNVLRDRKNMLRYLRLLMGAEGVAATDHVSQLFWSRAGLDDELAHDADLDIEAVYCLHAVTPDEGDRVTWLHTHGLAPLGAFDFDILNPCEDVMGGATDALRSIAFSVVEGTFKPSTPKIQIGHPNGVIRLVPVSEFHRLASREDQALRDNDEHHSTDRSVVCEPARGLLARGRRAEPSRFFSSAIAEGTVFHFSHTASDLMAERARNTLAVFQRLSEEFREFEFPALVKLGYQVDGGGPDEREHLWFTVHGVNAGAGTIDATLENHPHRIDRLKPGDRATHPVELLSDWTIMTPAGPITPRSQVAARRIRENADEIRRMMREYRAEQGG